MADAFAADPKSADNFAARHRYNAACAAALAGHGAGVDGGPLGSEERARWRDQALQWLRADLQALGQLLESGKPEMRRQVLRVLRHWQSDADLVALRDPSLLVELPTREQRACKRLWADVATLLVKAIAAELAATEAR
jgi:serine/threonine-protein kinase